MFKNLALDRPLAVLDAETTGKKVESARIIELSILKVSPDGSREHRTRRFNPGVPIPPAATAIHNIRDEDVAGEPGFASCARAVARFLDGCDLCGFNLRAYDLPLLLAEFGRAGVPFTTAGRRVVDPMTIYHAKEKRNLAAAYKLYCGADHEGAHGAEADVLAAAAVLDAIVVRYEGIPRSVAGLDGFNPDPDAVDPDGKLRREGGAVVLGFGKHEGCPLARVAEEAPDYLEWMLKGTFSAEVKALVAEALTPAAAISPLA